jgi:hypothetical protein
MGDAQRLEGALELTPGIPVVAARTGTEEAQGIRVDRIAFLPAGTLAGISVQQSAPRPRWIMLGVG